MPIPNQASNPVTELSIDGMAKQRPVRLTGTIRNPFAVPGMWLQGNLHSHLDRPGKPEWRSGAADHYRRMGYDFIGGMDHNQIVDLGEPANLVIVPGAEMSSPGHLLALGIRSLPQLDKPADPDDGMVAMIEAVKAAGGIAVLAHPFKSGYTWEALRRFCAAGLDGIEVVNSNVRGKGADSGRADQLWHNLLREGWPLLALGNDDAHGPHEDADRSGWGGIPHIAWTGVLAEDISAQGVLDAIRAGRTYASEGPRIKALSCTPDGKLTVRCSPCVACHFRATGGGLGGSSVYPPDGQGVDDIFVFDFAVSGYRVRERLIVVLQDEHGRRAWTSPIQVDIDITDR